MRFEIYKEDAVVPECEQEVPVILCKNVPTP